MQTLVQIHTKKHGNETATHFVSVDSRVLYSIDVVLQHLNFIPDVYAVGGCVRDLIMHKPMKDIDVASSVTPQILMKMCDDHGIKYITTGLEHGTITLVLDNVMVEHTTFRTDEQTDGRHASVKFSSSLQEDLMRRDFTMNAMAYRDNTVTDPFGGYLHMKMETLVAVGNAQDRFNEDYLRIVRALRFASRFGYSLDTDIISAINALSGKIRNHVALERIIQEIESVLSYGTKPATEFMRLFMAFNLHKLIFGYENKFYPVILMAEFGKLTTNRFLFFIYKDTSETVLKTLPIPTVVKKWILHSRTNKNEAPHKAFWNIRKHLTNDSDYFDEVVHEHYQTLMGLYTSEEFQQLYNNFPSDLEGKDIGLWQYGQWVSFLPN